MATTSQQSSSVPQIKVVFTTTDPTLILPPSARQLLVPADIARYGLSRILNSSSMLAANRPDDHTVVPLDFLVNGAFLRGPLQAHLAAAGLFSPESTVELTYVRSLIPPVFEASFPHDDWVSCVDVLSGTSHAGRASETGGQRVQSRILSASYDGLVRVWDASGSILALSPGGRSGGHSRRINAAKWLTSTTCASAGLDGRIITWKYTESPDTLSGALAPTMDLVGHEKMITHLDVNGSTRRILSSCADGSIGLWSASRRTAPAIDVSAQPPSTKRTKLSSSSAQRGPLALIPMHADTTSATIFHPSDASIAYSASHAHTLTTVDLTTQRTISTLTTAHPLLCLAALPPSRGLLAAGTSARHVTLIDPRDGTANIAAMTLRGHQNMVSDVAISPENDFSLVSASHDGTCKVWDLRSVRTAEGGDAGTGPVGEAVYTVQREGAGNPPATGDGVKVLSVVWDAEWGIVSGGEDKMVQINRGRDIVAK